MGLMTVMSVVCLTAFDNCYSICVAVSYICLWRLRWHDDFDVFAAFDDLNDCDVHDGLNT
jgi:hypothetical protein